MTVLLKVRQALQRAAVPAGLVDDDFGMELLVGGAIISLSLPVRLVWECVWRPTLPASGSEAPGHTRPMPCHLTCLCCIICPRSHAAAQHSGISFTLMPPVSHFSPVFNLQACLLQVRAQQSCHTAAR